YTEKQLALVYHKGVYLYDYIDSYDRFQETELPPIHEFYSTLKGKISQDDYKHAQKSSRCLDRVSKMSIKYYEPDPSQYVSASSLS
ncbi:14490_t:CDS:2, partial [Funneliformis geosporum]